MFFYPTLYLFVFAFNMNTYEAANVESDIRIVNYAGDAIDFFWVNVFDSSLKYPLPDRFVGPVNPSPIYNGSEITVNSLQSHKLLVRLCDHPHIDASFFKGPRDETYYVYFDKKYGLLLRRSLMEQFSMDLAPPLTSKAIGEEVELEEKISRDESYMRNVVECFEGRYNDKSTLFQRGDYLFRYNAGEPLINIRNAINTDDIRNIELLYHCVRTTMPGHIQDRPFNSGGAYGGSNNATFIGGFIGRLLPQLMNHILTIVNLATEQAMWRPDPRHLGVRCVEVLSYGPGKELLLHTDLNSVYTVVFMLSDTNSFDGGDFVIKPDDAARNHRVVAGPANHLIHSSPKRGDAIIFDSNAEHGVQPIYSGDRWVLVLELWIYENISPNHLRPTVEEFFGRQVQPTIIRHSQSSAGSGVASAAAAAAEGRGGIESAEIEAAGAAATPGTGIACESCRVTNEAKAVGSNGGSISTVLLTLSMTLNLLALCWVLAHRGRDKDTDSSRGENSTIPARGEKKARTAPTSSERDKTD